MEISQLKSRLIDIIRSQPGFDEKLFNAALESQRQTGGRLGTILSQDGKLNLKDLAVTLSGQLNLPPINLRQYKLDIALIELFPENAMRQNRMVPLSRMKDTVTVAISDPLDIFALDKLKTAEIFNIEIVLATDEDVKAALDSLYSGRGFDAKKTIKEIDEGGPGIVEAVSEEKINISKLIDKVRLPPISKIVDLLLSEALKTRSSDIHIEPSEKALKIRYRIDGALHSVLDLPKNSQNAIIARIKILSKLDIAQTHMPQDGSFKAKVGAKEIDFRVSVLPTVHGDKVVLRLLDKSNLGVGLDKMGFLPESTALFKKALAKPYGMILVTGPTGSGKSTTLYSILNEMNTLERNIVTLEDPVEYQIEGITQIQARPDIGLTFASGLRSVLRQNPDIIMIGEIRDFETADIAIKASLTGQMVFSTLHTNDASSAVTRLVDMGVEPFLIASSLIFICAQRLCRKICPDCKEICEIPKVVFERVGIDYEAIKNSGRDKFYKGRGCAKCHNSGFSGRMGVLEALLFDDKIKEMVAEKASDEEIKRHAISHGMKTLKDDAMEKFSNGLTTLEEVLSITAED